MSQERGQSPSMSLPDALAGLQRPGGTPDTLDLRSNDFSHAANQLDGICDDLTRLLRKVPGPWTGSSQAEFNQVMSGHPERFRTTAGGYRKAAGAIKVYASALEHAQQTWDASRRLADADWHRQMPPKDGVPPDPFSPDRVRARKQVESALERLRETTQRSRSVLSALENRLGSRPPHPPEIARGRGAAVMQALDEVYEMGRADWDALWELHKLYLPSTAVEAWEKRARAWADEFNRSCSDPVSYVGDMLYEYANADEFRSGNDARAVAGLIYNISGGPWKFLKRLALPEDRGKDHRKKDVEKKSELPSSCLPVG